MTNGTALESEATIDRVADSTMVRFSGLRVAFEDHAWSLRRPALLTLTPADWSIDDLTLAQLLEGAPYALEMARRLRRDHDPHHERAEKHQTNTAAEELA